MLRGELAPGVHAAIVPVPPLPATDALLGGAMTTFNFTAAAYDQPAPNLTAAELAVHDAGDVHFASEYFPNTGLGPQFNNVYCQGCHRDNGRGILPAAGASLQPLSMVLKMSLPGTSSNGGPVSVPNFGTQLQTRRVQPVALEGRVTVTHTAISGLYGDGQRFSLIRPALTVVSPHRPLPGGIQYSPRVAPPSIGMGLLEAIPAQAILALADPSDVNGDGISGRANTTWDAIAQRTALGRFGVKASTPTIRQQVAGAYNEDIGVTSSVFPAENCEGVYAACARHAPELADSRLNAVTFYTQTLGVPARRNMNDSTVRMGNAVFNSIGCANCHVSQFTTGTLPGVPAASNQVIHPYTDLLLHDMGVVLADRRPEFLANGQEWRTPPLWGIGLSQTVVPGSGFLHDGRARTLTEAILWHGGEGLSSREAFRTLPANLRSALVTFLSTL
ncbi:MAG: thiol oxidoreductase [Gemmatimonadetes bacterium]|nr:thiol oxidoreductase [Gemmatimonadota bacterium]